MLKYIIIFFCLIFGSANAATNTDTYFKVIALGTGGGESENNLSSYLLAPSDSDIWIAIDAGNLCGAIKEIPIQTFQDMNIGNQDKNLPQFFFENHVKSYLITHAHLDHIAGLVICSAKDSHKTILGLASTLEYLQHHIFNWKIWPNFGDAGIKPYLGQYHYQILKLSSTTLIPGTSVKVQAFQLSHGDNYPSTAFLLEHSGFYILYLGDTGADLVEHSHALHFIWQHIAPLIKQHKLQGIFIETSYTNERPKNKLFGHLTPALLIQELQELALMVNPAHPKNSLKGLKIFVTHTKENLSEEDNLRKIKKVLEQNNDLAVQFIFLQRGILTKF
jgi:3',5'-cyclic-nucleotide phosphodiesterase